MSYITLTKISGALSFGSIILAIWLEKDFIWAGFFIFLFIGLLFDKLNDQAEEIERLRDKDKNIL